MWWLSVCTVVHAGLRGVPTAAPAAPAVPAPAAPAVPAPAAPAAAPANATVSANASARVLLRVDATAEEAEEDVLADPREVFVPKCQAMVMVRFEDYLPVGAITKVCQDAGNHQGCHAWGDELTTLFRAGAQPDEYATWCGKFYDWFHERFASRCTHQCEKLACKPICLYHEQAAAIEQSEAELYVQDQAVFASQQRVAELDRDLDSAEAAEKQAAAAAVRVSDVLATAQKRRDEARRTYDKAAARVADAESKVETSEAAVKAARDIEAAADQTNIEMQHAVDRAKNQRQIAIRGVQRMKGELQYARKQERASFQKLSALKEMQAKKQAAFETKSKAVAKAEEKQAKKRAGLSKRMRNAKAELKEKRAERVAAKKKVAELKGQLAVKKKRGEGGQKPLAKKVQVADSERKGHLVEEKVAQRKVDDLKVAMKPLSDAEKKTAQKKKPLAWQEENLAKIAQRIFAAEGDEASAEAGVTEAQPNLEAAQEAVAVATAGVQNATSEQAQTAEALGAASKAVQKAVKTQSFAEQAAEQAERAALAPAETGLELAAKEVSAAEAALEEANDEAREAKEEAVLAKANREEEQRALDEARADLEAEKQELADQREALGPKPDGA